MALKLVKATDPRMNARALLWPALQYGRGFPTGAEIYDFLFAENVGRDFNIIVLGQEFATNGEMLALPEIANAFARNAFRAAFGVPYNPNGEYDQPVYALPAVLWAPNFRLPYYGDVEGCYWNVIGDLVAVPDQPNQERRLPQFYGQGNPALAYPAQYIYKSGRVQKPVVRLTRCRLPSWLVLYHELGHAKQYHSAPRGARQHIWGERIENVLNDIEAENLRLHEKRLCIESGTPVRRHYHDDFDAHLNNFHTRRISYQNNPWTNAWIEAYSPEQRAVEEARLEREATTNRIRRVTDGLLFDPNR